MRDTAAGSSPATRAPFLSLFTFPRPTQACAPPASLLPARRWVRRRRHGRAVVARPRAQLFLSSPFFLIDARRRRNGDRRGGRRRNGGASAGPPHRRVRPLEGERTTVEWLRVSALSHTRTARSSLEHGGSCPHPRGGSNAPASRRLWWLSRAATAGSSPGGETLVSLRRLCPLARVRVRRIESLLFCSFSFSIRNRFSFL